MRCVLLPMPRTGLRVAGAPKRSWPGNLVPNGRHRGTKARSPGQSQLKRKRERERGGRWMEKEEICFWILVLTHSDRHTHTEAYTRGFHEAANSSGNTAKLLLLLLQPDSQQQKADVQETRHCTSLDSFVGYRTNMARCKMSYRTGSGLKMESDEVGGDYAPTAAHNQRELGTSLAIVSYLTSRRCLPGPSEASLSLSLFFPPPSLLEVTSAVSTSLLRQLTTRGRKNWMELWSWTVEPVRVTECT